MSWRGSMPLLRLLCVDVPWTVSRREIRQKEWRGRRARRLKCVGWNWGRSSQWVRLFPSKQKTIGPTWTVVSPRIIMRRPTAADVGPIAFCVLCATLVSPAFKPWHLTNYRCTFVYILISHIAWYSADRQQMWLGDTKQPSDASAKDILILVR